MKHSDFGILLRRSFRERSAVYRNVRLPFRFGGDWDEPSDAPNGHYQRFLYRLKHFEALLGPEVIGVAQRERLAHCHIGVGSTATLNIAGRGNAVDASSLPESEADLEKRLSGVDQAERYRLMIGLGLIRLDRHPPACNKAVRSPTNSTRGGSLSVSGG
jgi:hypothetical protein